MFDLHNHAAQLRTAIESAVPGAEVDSDEAADAVALSFEHPAHQATCLLVLEPDAQVGVAMLVAVVIGPWEESRAKDGGASLFGLNPRLMTCAIGLLPINEDETAVVLCRRMPAGAVEPAEAVSLLDDMIWEYAQVSGWTEGEAAVEPPRPRLIGSLDEV